MDPWVQWATFITLVVGLIGLALGKAYSLWCKVGQKAVASHENEQRLEKADNLGADIHSLQEYYRSIAANIKHINDFGSDGAIKEFKKINHTLYNHGKRLKHIEGLVNGGTETVPPDEPYTEGVDAERIPE